MSDGNTTSSTVITMPSEIMTSNETRNNIERFYELSKWLNVSFITLITLVGFYGNLISILIFHSRLYRKSNSMKSLRLYLITLSYSDLIVLVSHYVDFTFRSWINLTEFYTAKFNFVDRFAFFCKLVPYTRNVFRAISVYILILMTLQRLMILYFPLKRAKWSSPSFNLKLVTILIAIAIPLNVNAIFMNTLLVHENRETFCSIDHQYLRLHFYFESGYNLITILIPIVIILIMSIILYKRTNLSTSKSSYEMRNVFKSKSYSENTTQQTSLTVAKKTEMPGNGRGELSAHEPTTSSSYEMKSVDFNHDKIIHSNQCSNNTALLANNLTEINTSSKNLLKKKNHQPTVNYKKQLANSVRTNYMLVLVSKWFILLHLPYFLSWCVLHMYMREHLNEYSSDQEILVAEKRQLKIFFWRAMVNLFEILFSLNYSINFFVYLFHGPLFQKLHSDQLVKFRDFFAKIYRRLCCS